MVSESIERVKKEKKVYNADTNEIENMNFLWSYQIDKYNNGLGDVNVADQLRGVYRMDWWITSGGGLCYSGLLDHYWPIHINSI